MTPRDRIADVGRATRLTIDRAMRAELGPLELRVLVVVFGELTAWSRLSETISARSIARAIYGTEPRRDQRERVAKALARLDAKGVLVVEPGRGRTAAARVALQTWSTEDVFGGEYEAGNTSCGDHDSEEKRGPVENETCLAEARNVVSASSQTEEVPEELSSRVRAAAGTREADPNCPLCHGTGTVQSPSAGADGEPFRIACECTRYEPAGPPVDRARGYELARAALPRAAK